MDDDNFDSLEEDMDDCELTEDEEFLRMWSTAHIVDSVVRRNRYILGKAIESIIDEIQSHDGKYEHSRITARETVDKMVKPEELREGFVYFFEGVTQLIDKFGEMKNKQTDEKIKKDFVVNDCM